jgi:hypothetical protein
LRDITLFRDKMREKALFDFNQKMLMLEPGFYDEENNITIIVE